MRRQVPGGFPFGSSFVLQVLPLKDSAYPKPTPPVSERFPAAVYAGTVLAENFEDAKKYFLDALLEIHAAHTLMLARQGIIPGADARRIIDVLAKLDHAGILAARYDGSFEDLFFHVQDRLVKACGEDVAGKMHTARSRNDIDLTMYPMCLRREALRIAAEVSSVRKVLLNLAEANIDTVMPAYTHTQPAQPTTLAHYLLAAVEFLGRDELRLRAAFATINRNPLGACAITTTGFPIDREYTAKLLGFEGLQTNSYGAIAAVDYVTETAGAVAVLAVSLGKLVQDLLLWRTMEFGFLRLSDAYVQGSSIMPQKRNPVALEHTRILAGKALGQAQAVLTCAHNTPFGDIVDSEDDLQPLVFSMCHDASRALRLFAGLMSHAEVNREHLLHRAEGNFLTVTELADTLVREEGISFLAAHHLVAAAVRAAGRNDSPERLVTEIEKLAPESLGRHLRALRET
ncbi:MAG TPA: argininosuccinate lyase [Candidatus Acidoferrales bacterium]|nr:argininosuccinate lyase [Candidatus Acidoferrales bacterium]